MNLSTSTNDSTAVSTADIAQWEEDYGVYTLVPPPTWLVDVEPFDADVPCIWCEGTGVGYHTEPRPDFCQAIDGVEHGVHQHAMGRLDLATGQFDGDPYCVAIRSDDRTTTNSSSSTRPVGSSDDGAEAVRRLRRLARGKAMAARYVMNREDGFPIADIDVGLFHDQKVVALARRIRDERQTATHVALYVNLVLES
jgi:hypothetical protein